MKKQNVKLLFWGVFALVLGFIIGLVITGTVVGNAVKTMSNTVAEFENDDGTVLGIGCCCDAPACSRWSKRCCPPPIRDGGTMVQ